MTRKEIIKAIIFHTDEERLGQYAKTVAQKIVQVICFIYAAGLTVRAYYETTKQFITKAVETSIKFYTQVSQEVQAKLDDFHYGASLRPSSEDKALPQAKGG